MLMKFQKTPVQSSLSRMMDEFFNGGLSELENQKLMATQPSVNVIENEDSFIVEVAAPGLKKEDFNLTVEDEMLIISAEKKDESEKKEGSFTKREFNYSSFTRSFQLPEICKSEDIAASYTEGVLTLTIPKVEEAKKQPPKKISIS